MLSHNFKVGCSVEHKDKFTLKNIIGYVMFFFLLNKWLTLGEKYGILVFQWK
jgi:hypothetical protein